MQNCIDIKDLTVVFGNHPALTNISFSVEENNFITIIGPNGGGKSTLLKVILGLITPTSGKVIINNSGTEVGNGLNNNRKDINPIAYVPQIKTLDRSFPALPIELVLTGIKGKWSARISKDERQAALSALEQVGAAHLQNRTISRLSGGELQRIYLARAFVRKPKILLLDEPATGIDMSGDNDINHIIDCYHEKHGTTVLMVTHDWESAYHHADKVLMINQSVICYDVPQNAFDDNNLRTAFGHIGHKHQMIFGVKDE